jgi:hypothetical protein
VEESQYEGSAGPVMEGAGGAAALSSMFENQARLHQARVHFVSRYTDDFESFTKQRLCQCGHLTEQRIANMLHVL